LAQAVRRTKGTKHKAQSTKYQDDPTILQTRRLHQLGHSVDTPAHGLVSQASWAKSTRLCYQDHGHVDLDLPVFDGRHHSPATNLQTQFPDQGPPDGWSVCLLLRHTSSPDICLVRPPLQYLQRGPGRGASSIHPGWHDSVLTDGPTGYHFN